MKKILIQKRYLVPPSLPAADKHRLAEAYRRKDFGGSRCHVVITHNTITLTLQRL